MKELIKQIILSASNFLNVEQLKRLEALLKQKLSKETTSNTVDDLDLTEKFIEAKKIEGCSLKTLHYYETSIKQMLIYVGKKPEQITTDDLRQYLSNYHEVRNASHTTVDNLRRIYSSFFAWLKSPVRRIHKVRTEKNIKETYSDENLEILRDSCSVTRDLAITDMLSSTGMRVGEMVLLNKEDIDFNERECIVFGKGSKERIVYFDARTKIHLQNYLDS